MIFEEKLFSRYILLTDQISLPVPLLLEVLGIIFIVIVCFSVCDIVIYEIPDGFLMKLLWSCYGVPT